MQLDAMYFVIRKRHSNEIRNCDFNKANIFDWLNILFHFISIPIGILKIK